MNSKDHLSDLEEQIEYSFSSPELLVCALTHSSYVNENRQEEGISDYERLEFLGDAVLELIVSAFLFNRYPDRPEGDLSRMRASLVCEDALSLCAAGLNLTDYIRLGRGERVNGGNFKKSILSDVMEALIGAIYLDSGRDLETAGRFVEACILKNIPESVSVKDAKSMLQEYAQHMGSTVHYELISQEGPAHCRTYSTAVYIGNELAGRGKGTSKKHSEQDAAQNALQVLGCI